MFDSILGKPNTTNEVDDERNFVREQSSTSGALNPADDQFFTMEKRRQDDLLRWQQDLDDEMEHLKHDLRNEFYDPDSGKWVKKQIHVYDPDQQQYVFVEMPPMMNELGIAEIEMLIRPLLSRNLMNSNLTEKRILVILRNTADTLVFHLGERYKMYDIEVDNLSPIVRMVKNIIIPAPYRAMNDGERKHARTMNKRIETYNEAAQSQEKKRGLFGGW